jgi:hypothetical protein
MTVNFIDLYTKPPFRQVCEMEDHLATINDLLRGLCRIAETLNEDEGAVVMRLGHLAIRECESAENLRGELFRLTHPNRQHFDKEGWPGDEIADATA